MGYHENPAINDAILSIINDGDGSQCGVSYKQRLGALESALNVFVKAGYGFSTWNVEHDSQPLSRKDILEAAHVLLDYYYEHMKEMK
jgi:hypothetical protein